MGDGFDRSGFVLDMMDCSVLYKDRLDGDDVFSTDISLSSLIEIILMVYYKAQKEKGKEWWRGW